MTGVKGEEVLWVRFRNPDGSVVEIDHPEGMRVIGIRPFEVDQPVAKLSTVPRLNLGRFLRARSLPGLVRALVRATEGWPQAECRALCRRLAARINARGPSVVTPLFGASLGEESLYCQLVGAFTKARLMALAACLSNWAGPDLVDTSIARTVIHDRGER